MVIDEKNTAMNSFTGGMDSDTSDTMIKNDHYRLAKNVRCVTDTEQNSGELHLVKGWEEKIHINGSKIKASTLIRNIGIIITEDQQTKSWCVKQFFNGETDLYIVFGPCKEELGNNISLTTRWEDNDNIKLYIADGEHLVLIVKLYDKPFVKDIKILTDINQISSTPYANLKKPIFAGLISGSIKGSLVQYSYQFYKLHSGCTNISPQTRLIPLYKGNVDSSKSLNITGFESEDTSDKGVSIKIPLPDNDNIRKSFDSIKIYRTAYIQAGLNPTIDLIYDAKLDFNQRYFYFSDPGLTALSTITIEEYNSMTGIHIIPKVIESKNDYLFAANIKTDNKLDDDLLNYDTRAFLVGNNEFGWVYCDNNSRKVLIRKEIINSGNITKGDVFNRFNDMSKEYSENDISDDICVYDVDGYYGGTGKNISWRFVISELVGDANEIGNKDYYLGRCGTKTPYISLKDTGLFTEKTIPFFYIKKNGILEKINNFNTTDITDYIDTTNDEINHNRTYANPAVTYFMKSLRRDELYRYGIIFYDKNGNTSSVKWIADIRIPNMTWRGFNTFISHAKNKELIVRPLGIQFDVKMPDNKDIVGYEIVRCNRKVSDISTVSQGVLSRPVRRLTDNACDGASSIPSTLTPTGFLSTNTIWTGKGDNKKVPLIVYGTHKDYQVPKTLYDGDDNEAYFNWQAFNGEVYENRLSSEYRNENNRTHFTGNKNVYQFVSPEVCYQSDSTKDLLKNSNLEISPNLYLFGSRYDESDGNRHNYQSNYYPLYHGSNDSGSFEYNNATTWIHPSTTKYGNLPAIVGINQESNALLYNDINNNYISRCIGIPNGLGTYVYYIKDIFSKIENNSSFKDYLNQENRYTYIKLYESSNVVQCNNQKINTFLTANGNDSINIKSKSINTNNLEIESTAFPETLGWNDFITASKSDGKEESVNVTASDHVTTIGMNNYCNWVFPGAFGLPYLDQGNSQLHMGWSDLLDDTVSDMSLVFGNAGKTALVSIKDCDELNNIINTNFTDCHFEYNDDTSDIILKNATLLANVSSLYLQTPSLDRYRSNQGFKTLFRDSILGTYLCNLRLNVTPYGGYTELARDLSTYASYGDYYSTGGKHIIFDGDCFIEPFEYVSMHKWYSSKVRFSHNACIVYSIPVESNINLVYTSGYEFSKMKNQSNTDITNIQVDPSNVNNKFLQEKPLYVYNGAYSSNVTNRIFAAKQEVLDDRSDILDYRVMYSNKKDNNEEVDSWAKFMPAQFLDIDTRYGAITGLRYFNDELLFWQERSFGKISVNEQVVLSDNSNSPLILGTGGVAQRYDYYPISDGMKEGDFSDVYSDTTLYWWDSNKNEICAYSKGNAPIILSKIKNIQNFINKLRKNTINKPCLAYDKHFNEALFSLYESKYPDDGSLAYSEIISSFNGLYSINFGNKVQFDDRLYLLTDTDIYEWNKSIDRLKPYVRFTVNSNPSVVKVFDNGEISGRLYKGNNVDNLHIEFDTPLKLHGEITGKNMSNREYNFDYAIPRNEGSTYGDRLRGKFMEQTITSDSTDNDFSIENVLTKFRTSWT